MILYYLVMHDMGTQRARARGGGSAFLYLLNPAHLVNYCINLPPATFLFASQISAFGDN
jgi:hypothetical protein